MSNYNQSLIEDYRQTIERLQKECTEKTNAIIALGEHLKAKTHEYEELKERTKCNCFDPKSNNNRCISYNRIAEDYERDLKKLNKYKQALDTVSEYIKDNCNSCQGIKYGGCEKCELKRIKDIINKAKGEGNE